MRCCCPPPDTLQLNFYVFSIDNFLYRSLVTEDTAQSLVARDFTRAWNANPARLDFNGYESIFTRIEAGEATTFAGDMVSRRALARV